MGAIRQAQIDSIQKPPDALKTTAQRVWPYVIERGPLLPAYGSRRRLLWQRYYDRYDTNTVWMGASAAMGKKVAATPYELRGPKGMDIRHWEALYRNADFGRGMTSLTKKLTRDFFRFDIGAWLEIAGPGNPMLPMIGAPTGLTVLDPMHIWPTGDPIYPAFYEREGALHLLHHDRVIQFVDAPETDENFPGWGLSALSRAISFIQQMMLMNRYVNEQLDDTPPSGFMLYGNIQDATILTAISKMKRGLSTDEPDVMGRTVFIRGDFAEYEPKLTPIAMATPPEKFDYEQYLNINVDATALALGIDRQEIWQLTGHGIGTGTQSNVLHSKSQGRTYGDILAMFTRAINGLMPEKLEFEYKFRDADEDAAQAQTRQTNYSAVMSVDSIISVDEQRRLLALLDSSAQDVLTDPDGEMISLDDADVRPDDAGVIVDDETALTDGQTETEKPTPTPDRKPLLTMPDANNKPQAGATATETTPENIEATSGLNGAQIRAAIDVLAGVTDGSTAPEVAIELLVAVGIERSRAVFMVEATISQRSEQPEEQKPEGEPKPSLTANLKRLWFTKDFADTSVRFARVFVDVMNEGLDDEINRRRFGIILRNELRKAGIDAFKDGMEKGGVSRENFTNDNHTTVLAIAAEESKHVTSLGAKLFYGGGVSEDEVLRRSALWINKSLRRFLHAGIESAARNGAFGWRLGETEDHCRSCLSASRKVALFRTWRKHNIEPGSERLFCGGYKCDCEFFRTDQKVTGGLSRIPLQ